MGDVNIVISADNKDAVRKLRAIASAINKTAKEQDQANKRTVSGFNRLITKIGATVAAYVTFRAAIHAAETAMRSYIKLVTGAMDAADRFSISVSGVASVITSMMDAGSPEELAKNFQNATTYATALQTKLDEVAATTLLTGEQVRHVNEQFIKKGQILDLNNEKQINGLKAVANALKVVLGAQLDERQIMQETLGLIDGKVDQSTRLTQILTAANPELREQLMLWRESGTTLEHMADVLKGFVAGSATLENTWQTVKSTLQTTVEVILRNFGLAIRDDVIGPAKELNETLKTAEKRIVEGLTKSFFVVESIVKSIYEWLKSAIGEIDIFLKKLGIVANKLPDLNKMPWWAKAFGPGPAFFEGIRAFQNYPQEPTTPDNLLGNLGGLNMDEINNKTRKAMSEVYVDIPKEALMAQEEISHALMEQRATLREQADLENYLVARGAELEAQINREIAAEERKAKELDKQLRKRGEALDAQIEAEFKQQEVFQQTIDTSERVVATVSEAPVKVGEALGSVFGVLDAELREFETRFGRTFRAIGEGVKTARWAFDTPEQWRAVFPGVRVPLNLQGRNWDQILGAAGFANQGLPSPLVARANRRRAMDVFGYPGVGWDEVNRRIQASYIRPDLFANEAVKTVQKHVRRVEYLS